MLLMKKHPIIVHEVNGIVVEQKILNGFLNATAMCTSHSKDIREWLKNKKTFEYFNLLNKRIFGENQTGVIPINSDGVSLTATIYVKYFPELISSKRGAPENGGGVWVHPKLAIKLGQWVSLEFEMQVSDWVEEWMVTGKNPITSQADIDRIKYRTSLKDESRVRMTDQVKLYLEDIKKYDQEKYASLYFVKVHDHINKAITTETAKQMRERLSLILGREVKGTELIRDYFPALDLQKYIAICEITANLLIRDKGNPLEAVQIACELALPADYKPQSIDFVESIKLVHGRVQSPQLGFK